MKHVFKVFLASMLATLLGCTVVTSHHASAAENLPAEAEVTAPAPPAEASAPAPPGEAG